MRLLAIASAVAILTAAYVPAAAVEANDYTGFGPTKGTVQINAPAEAAADSAPASFPWAILLIGAVGLAVAVRRRSNAPSRWCDLEEEHPRVAQ
jgi:hypothetical protein